MTEFQRLKDAVEKLHESVSNFHVGAVSLDDYKPTEERIKDIRDSLTQLNSRLLMLKAQKNYQNTEVPEENIKDIVTKLHEATSNSLLNSKAIKMCLHSYTIQSILRGEEGNEEMRMKINTCMDKLFIINDETLAIQKEIDEAVQKQLDLKIECQNMIFDHKKFLEEQEEVRNRRLQEKNPETANNKKKLVQTVDKINVMKKLIVNFIGASYLLLMEEPVLVDMLEKHRDLISIETILKMAQSN
ncbi:uncharacterized protein LOC143209700 [Lasioglossum baleicum]|uniref:uncharacterized protein LOC143209700 n=1 Tax=Lasioglossum baleicum TaxID=434251 RepID=UPI003FCCEB64